MAPKYVNPTGARASVFAADTPLQEQRCTRQALCNHHAPGWWSFFGGGGERSVSERWGLMGEFDLSYLFFFPCSLERLGFFFFLFFFFFTTMVGSNNVIFNTAESLYFFFFYCTFNKAKSHYWTQSNLRYFYYQCLQMKEARKIIAIY